MTPELWPKNDKKLRGYFRKKLGGDVRHALPYFSPDQNLDTLFQNWRLGARRVTGARDKLLRHVHGSWRKH